MKNFSARMLRRALLAPLDVFELSLLLGAALLHIVALSSCIFVAHVVESVKRLVFCSGAHAAAAAAASANAE